MYLHDSDGTSGVCVYLHDSDGTSGVCVYLHDSDGTSGVCVYLHDSDGTSGVCVCTCMTLMALVECVYLHDSDGTSGVCVYLHDSDGTSGVCVYLHDSDGTSGVCVCTCMTLMALVECVCTCMTLMLSLRWISVSLASFFLREATLLSRCSRCLAYSDPMSLSAAWSPWPTCVWGRGGEGNGIGLTYIIETQLDHRSQEWFSTRTCSKSSRCFLHSSFTASLSSFGS